MYTRYNIWMIKLDCIRIPVGCLCPIALIVLQTVSLKTTSPKKLWVDCRPRYFWSVARCYPVVPMVYPRTKESQPFHCWEPSPARAWSSRPFAASLSSITAACAACREALLLRHKGILRAALTCGNCAWIKGMIVFFPVVVNGFWFSLSWAQQRACKSPQASSRMERLKMEWFSF